MCDFQAEMVVVYYILLYLFLFFVGVGVGKIRHAGKSTVGDTQNIGYTTFLNNPCISHYFIIESVPVVP